MRISPLLINPVPGLLEKNYMYKLLFIHISFQFNYSLIPLLMKQFLIHSKN